MLPNISMISKQSANSTSYPLLTPVYSKLGVLFVLDLWPKLFQISCSHGQSNYRAWSHPNISLSFNYFLKQITNIFVTEALTDKNIYRIKVRGDIEAWVAIVTISAKVSLYSLHPLLPSPPVIKPYKRQNLSSHIFQFYCSSSHSLSVLSMLTSHHLLMAFWKAPARSPFLAWMKL